MVQQPSLGRSSARCAVWCSLQHFPLAELVMGKTHILGMSLMQTLFHFGLDVLCTKHQ